MWIRVTRAALAAVLGLALAGGLSPRLPIPFGQPVQQALALDEEITVCDWETFDAALDAVQADGGGTITFDCGGPATIIFDEEVTITSDVTIIGGGQVEFDGNGARRLFTVAAAARLELIGLTLQDGATDIGAAIRNSGTLDVIYSILRGNNATLSGGAITNTNGAVTIIGSTFSGNVADHPTLSEGGAIYSEAGALTIIASTFSGSAVRSGGGAVFTGSPTTITASTFDNNTGGLGGAIMSQANMLTISGSTFNGNTASNGGAIVNGGMLDVTTSTFSGNTVAGTGGAIVNGDTLTLTASTVVDNEAGSQGGGVLTGSANTTTITGSIVALNTAPTGPNCHSFGTQNSGGSNLSNNAECGFSSPGDVINSVDIDLEDLDDYGGPTRTRPPQTGSDAIDNADCNLIPADDQRGAPRPGTDCDIGAVELGATVPVQIFAYLSTSGELEEGDTAGLLAIASGPANDDLSYAFDCDDSGNYETPGLGTGTTGTGSCTLSDVGMHTVGLQVCDGDSDNCDSETIILTVLQSIPEVATPVVIPSPSDEGTIVTASAAFSASGAVACTVDYGAGDGPVAGTLGIDTCAGPEHTYLDDDVYTVTIAVIDAEDDTGSNSVAHTVSNLPPVIDSIMTDAPVPQGQPVTITVEASDPGINDMLTYSFDCDNDGTYETPGVGNEGQCTLDPAAATSTIGVQVMDDDLGVATDTVVVGQVLTMCLNYGTGAISAAEPGGTCNGGTVALTLPAPYALTFCINTWTGGLKWSASGQCPVGQRTHVVPGSGPLHYCEHNWLGSLRVPQVPSQCNAYETPGVIPG